MVIVEINHLEKLSKKKATANLILPFTTAKNKEKIN